MSNRVRQAFQAAAGAAGGDALTVDQVFSTTLYNGNWDGGAATTNQIVNDIDLAADGGLVWIKSRGQSNLTHRLFDSESSAGVTGFYNLNSSSNAAAGGPNTSMMTSFNTDGFTVGANADVNSAYHANTEFTSWTFKKAPKFFDIVQFTGDGTSNRSISHNITNAGLIVVKQTNNVGNWFVWHRHFSSLSSGSGYVQFNSQYQAINTTGVIDNITSTSFDVHAGATNGSGQSFIAYIFADNSSEDAADQMIRCGSYTGNGNSTGPVINLGWQPQWLLVKKSSDSDNWHIFDQMRGLVTGANDAALYPNLSSAEASTTYASLTATGWSIDTSAGALNQNGETFIYMAIRAPMMAEPTAATEVFDIKTYTGSSNFSSLTGLTTSRVDSTLNFIRTGYGAGSLIWSRLTGPSALKTWSTATEGDTSDTVQWDFNNKITITGGSTGSTGSQYVNYFWKRAKSYFDVVAYSGTSINPQDVHHSLSVVPEMVWHKKRNATSDWKIWHKDAQAGGDEEDGLKFTDGDISSDLFYTVDITGNSGYIRMAQSGSNFNGSGTNYIMYLFASLAGVSKVGSITHGDGATDVDCGFSNGSRFVLLKRTDASGGWYVFDSVRGISNSTEPYFLLNSNAAEVNENYISPLSSGFTVTDPMTSGDYIFYAIA